MKNYLQLLSDVEMMQIMLARAIRFMLYPDQQIIDQYRRMWGYVGPTPQAFKPGVADRLLLKKLLADYLNGMPRNMKCRHNANVSALRVLFFYFYQDYQY